jgi:hypothetical protein
LAERALFGQEPGLEIMWLSQKRIQIDEKTTKTVPVTMLKLKNTVGFSEEELQLLRGHPEILDVKKAEDECACLTEVQISSLSAPRDAIICQCAHIIAKALNINDPLDLLKVFRADLKRPFLFSISYPV